MATNAGLRVLNDNKILVIDQNYRNLFMLNKQVFSGIFAGQASGSYKSITIHYAASSPDSLVAFTLTPKLTARADSYYTVWGDGQGLYQSGGLLKNGYISCIRLAPDYCASAGYAANTYRLIFNSLTADIVPPEGFTITFYEFGLIPKTQKPVAGAGLVISDANGDVVFDSNRKPMRVAAFNYTDLLITTLRNVPAGGGSYLAWAKHNMAYPTTGQGREYAICMLESCNYFYNDIVPSQGDIATSSGRTSNDVFMFQEDMIRIARPCVNDREVGSDLTASNLIFAGNLKPMYMILDVTYY